MSPDTDYERYGDVVNVVFCCGWTLVGSQIRIYYAGADTCLALATAELGDLLTLLS